jgi:hypothetical protein
MAGIAPPPQGMAQPAPAVPQVAVAQVQQPAIAQGMQMPAAPKHRNFRQFYDDGTKDPCNGDYARIMSRFDPEVAPAVASEVLLEQAVGSRSDVHQAYLCCTATRRGPRIFCILLLSRFTSALDGRVTPWDNNLYAFLGDVTQDIATTVCFPANAFTPIANVFAYTEEYILSNLQNLNGLDVFPPQAAANNHTTSVTTRPLMYLPSRYVHLYLDASGYTAKQIWQLLPPLFTQYQDMANCQALIKWRRVASHGTALQNAQGQPIIGAPSVAIPLVSPVADRDQKEVTAAR